MGGWGTAAGSPHCTAVIRLLARGAAGHPRLQPTAPPAPFTRAGELRQSGALGACLPGGRRASAPACLPCSCARVPASLPRRFFRSSAQSHSRPACPALIPGQYLGTWHQIAVAVKVLLRADAGVDSPRALAPSSPGLAKLEAEAGLLASLRHPYIVAFCEYEWWLMLMLGFRSWDGTPEAEGFQPLAAITMHHACATPCIAASCEPAGLQHSAAGPRRGGLRPVCRAAAGCWLAAHMRSHHPNVSSRG